MAGYEPERENLVLSRGADFVHIYRKNTKDPDFPEGTTAEIIITRDNKTTAPILATWPAENISEDEISFWVQSPSTDQIPERVAYRLMVHYPPAIDGAETQDFCWFVGKIKRSQ